MVKIMKNLIIKLLLQKKRKRRANQVLVTKINKKIKFINNYGLQMVNLLMVEVMSHHLLTVEAVNLLIIKTNKKSKMKFYVKKY